MASFTKTSGYLVISLLSMYAGSALVQSVVPTDMDLTKELEQVREERLKTKQSATVLDEKSMIPVVKQNKV